MTVSRAPQASIDIPSDASPFCAKGTLWLGVRAYTDLHVPGGLERVSRELSPPLQTFFSQMFLATGWFDLFPMLAVTRALAAVTGREHMDQIRLIATWHGESDLKNVYRAMLKQATPLAVCRRFTSLYSQLYNFGRVEVLKEDDKSVAACAHGMPEPLAGWWKQATESYLQPILHASGGRNSRIDWASLEPDGERVGVPLVRVPSVTRWT